MTEAMPVIALEFVRPVAVRFTVPPETFPPTVSVPVDVKLKALNELEAPKFVLPL